MVASGNPNIMRYNCVANGCFNILRRPKIELFDICFPRKIQMGDVDGITEIKSKALMLEWKSFLAEPSGGQRIMHESLSRTGVISVLEVVGNAEFMTVSHFGMFPKGKWTGWKDGTIEDVMEVITEWADWADQGQPAEAGFISHHAPLWIK